ncbi:MAG: hypothetical protein QXK88_09035 [Desulfurococcaceae archaeon]
MLGGVGNNLGVLVGVLIYTIVRTLIILYKSALAVIIPMSPEWLEYILIGMALILITLFRPQGLIPEKPTLTLARSNTSIYIMIFSSRVLKTPTAPWRSY